MDSDVIEELGRVKSDVQLLAVESQEREKALRSTNEAIRLLDQRTSDAHLTLVRELESLRTRQAASSPTNVPDDLSRFQASVQEWVRKLEVDFAELRNTVESCAGRNAETLRSVQDLNDAQAEDRERLAMETKSFAVQHAHVQELMEHMNEDLSRTRDETEKQQLDYDDLRDQWMKFKKDIDNKLDAFGEPPPTLQEAFKEYVRRVEEDAEKMKDDLFAEQEAIKAVLAEMEEMRKTVLDVQRRQGTSSGEPPSAWSAFASGVHENIDAIRRQVKDLRAYHVTNAPNDSTTTLSSQQIIDVIDTHVGPTLKALEPLTICGTRLRGIEQLEAKLAELEDHIDAARTSLDMLGLDVSMRKVQDVAGDSSRLSAIDSVRVKQAIQEVSKAVETIGEQRIQDIKDISDKLRTLEAGSEPLSKKALEVATDALQRACRVATDVNEKHADMKRELRHCFENQMTIGQKVDRVLERIEIPQAVSNLNNLDNTLHQRQDQLFEELVQDVSSLRSHVNQLGSTQHELAGRIEHLQTLQPRLQMVRDEQKSFMNTQSRFFGQQLEALVNDVQELQGLKHAIRLDSKELARFETAVERMEMEVARLGDDTLRLREEMRVRSNWVVERNQAPELPSSFSTALQRAGNKILWNIPAHQLSQKILLSDAFAVGPASAHLKFFAVGSKMARPGMCSLYLQVSSEVDITVKFRLFLHDVESEVYECRWEANRVKDKGRHDFCPLPDVHADIQVGVEVLHVETFLNTAQISVK